MTNWYDTCTDEEYEAWGNSDEYSEIANRGEHAYLLTHKAGIIPNGSELTCPYEDGTKEHDAWYSGYGRHGN